MKQKLIGSLSSRESLKGVLSRNEKITINPNIEPLTVTENGEYKAPENIHGYNPVNVNVPSRYDEGYTEGYNKGNTDGYNSGYENGYQASQDSITLQEKTTTKNGTVTADEGYTGLSKVNVEVPERYNEGYTEGKQDGYSEGFQASQDSIKLQEKTTTKNGEVTADDGFTGLSKVNVKVPERYDEGYNDGYDNGFGEGVSSVKLQTKTITENGEYTPDNGYSGFSKVNVSVTVPLGKEEQEKTVDITKNGTTEITPDEGKVLSRVTVNVEVPDKYNEGYDVGFEEGYIDGKMDGQSQCEARHQPSKTISENGTYSPDNGYTAISKVVVQVPIPDGYIKPSGTKEITENGIHDVAEYSSVNVNVPLSGGVDDSEIEKFVNLIGDDIEDFESDRITSVSQYAFSYKSNLKNVSLPNLKSSNTRVFSNCDSLVSLLIPNMSGYTYQYMCAYCGALKTADVRQASYVSSYSFYSCSNLTTLEFNRVGTIATNAFNGCSKLATLILRTPSVVTLSGTSVFTGTKIAGTGGYIYVPSSLVEDYKSASNWSTYASKFRAIEDYPDITGGA